MADRSVIAYLHDDPTASASAGVQNAAVEAYCDAEGLDASMLYIDTDTRHSYWTMLSGLGEGDVVVMASLDLLGERPAERAGRLLALLAGGADVRCADRLPPLEALRATWAGGETRARRRRAREGMRKRALRGQVLGRPPYGYAVEDRRLVRHPREAEVVRRIFDDYLDRGEGIRRIAAGLNADGIGTRRGRPWAAGSVRSILRNPVYTGLYRRLGVAVPHAHEALIPRARFDDVQRRMARRRTAVSEQHREPYLLAGLLRCGACGGRMIGARRPAEGAGGGEHRYYRCASRTNEGRCAYGTWRADDLEAEVRRLLASDEILPVAARTGQPPDAGSARRERLERVLAAMLDRWVSGEWTDHDFERRAARPAVSLAALDEPEPERPPADVARTRLTEEWETLDTAERRRLLVAAVGEVTVRGDEVRLALAR